MTLIGSMKYAQVCYLPLQWRHNGRDNVSNHQPCECLLNRLIRCWSKKTSKLCVTGLCAGNSPETSEFGEFPAQRASNVENVSIWWRHHAHQFLAATKQLYKWYFPSVCLSVRLSVCLSHLFHHVPIMVSSWNFQELLPWSKVMSMQKVKVRGQRSMSQRSTPNLAVSGL